MPGRYALVQFVPEPVRGERINIGLVAWGASEIRYQFIADWRRVRAFTDGNISHAKDFVREFGRRLASSEMPDLIQASGSQEPCVEKLERMVKTWSGTIQFSDVRGSLKPPISIIEEMAPVFLPTERQNAKRQTKKTAASFVAQSVRRAVENKLNIVDTNKYVHTRHAVEGHLDEHEMDVVIANGSVIAAVQALSFCVAETSRLEKEIDSMAWSFDDISRKSKRMHLGVFVIPPADKDNRQYRRAKRLFPAMNVDFLEGRHVDTWAMKQATTLRLHTR